MKWKKILPELYQKIRVKGGRVEHQLTNNRGIEHQIEEIIIYFEIEDFEYEDPFYGIQNACGNFEMEVDLLFCLEEFEINSIFELEDRNFIFPTENLIGSFSNSIHFSVINCQFGKIKDGKIDFEMIYILTNGDSYSFMDGTFKDHATINGKIKTKLILNSLIVAVSKMKNASGIFNRINKADYRIDEMKEAPGLDFHYDRYDVYEIPIKSK
ncbi:MAG: hypothetical protein ACI9XO_003202 [Paraglaciecola sp.]|jgi:hypothetical protein